MDRDPSIGAEGLELREILRGYPGDCELQLALWLADGTRVYLKSDTMKVSLDAEMRARVEECLATGNFKLLGNTGAKKRYGKPAQNGNGNRQYSRA